MRDVFQFLFYCSFDVNRRLEGVSVVLLFARFFPSLLLAVYCFRSCILYYWRYVILNCLSLHFWRELRHFCLVLTNRLPHVLYFCISLHLICSLFHYIEVTCIVYACRACRTRHCVVDPASRVAINYLRDMCVFVQTTELVLVTL